MSILRSPGPGTLLACILAIGAQCMSSAAADEAPKEYVGRGLYLSAMSAERGRRLFVAKDCVVCQSVNGVGGEHAPRLDASITQGFINPLDFVARMWRGAKSMIALQSEVLGKQMTLTGQELGDIIAFAHDEEEQKKLSASDLPPATRQIIKSWNR